ncbi:uncharacterized protein LOC110705821 [Chenopodium quinoa]|uniref:uncharacterized protein LOC110705821 n=1 Tax=Chenopodium quinoa TaxID=63459 RepID=UPI000B77C836|nr:uncharacterized protein LOC110705821 [Chenopodium quinoa]
MGGRGGEAKGEHFVEPIVVLKRSPRKQSQKKPTPEIQAIQTPVNPTPQIPTPVNPTPQIPTPVNPTPQISDHGKTSDIAGSSRSSKVFPIIKRKVPLTTARRKGLQLSVSEGSNSLSQGVKSRRTNALTVNLGDDDQNLGSDDDDDEEDNYEPTGGDENEDNEDESLDEEDQEEEVSGAIIHDNFDPFEAEVFDDGDDDDNYFMRDVVRDYCIQCGFSVVVDKATNLRYTVLCSAEGCEWRLHASKLPDGVTWAIKSIRNPEHTCSGLDVNNPMMAISTLYRVKHKALAEIHSSHDESYAFLPKYCEMIKSTNPGSSAFCAWVELQEPEKPLACRSLIGVDGAHLKGNYGGVLLFAVALDANNELYPFAWTIESGEDTNTWCFFVWHLKNMLKDLGREDNWCIISDIQKGIDLALTELWNEVDRRYCCKHLVANWKKEFPRPLLFSLF